MYAQFRRDTVARWLDRHIYIYVLSEGWCTVVLKNMPFNIRICLVFYYEIRKLFIFLISLYYTY